MVSESVTVVNKMGFHMRPASLFVQEMSRFRSSITLDYNGRIIDGKSIMNVMASCIKCGTELVVRCDGPDEGEMLQAAVALVNNKLGDPE
ncbi:MAG: HPr family phosphocarrier protein [Oscillospiraceae bacterium]